MAVPHVMIELGGQDRPLRFNNEAQYAFEKRNGRSLVALLISFWKAQQEGKQAEIMMSTVLLVDLLLAGLMHRNRKVTSADIFGWLDTLEMRGGNVFTEVWPKVMQAIEASDVVQAMTKQAPDAGADGAEDTGDGPGKNEPAEPEAGASPSPSSGSETGLITPPN